MQTTKKWWQSSTIWGIVISALGYVVTNVLQVPNVSVPENADFNQLKAIVDGIKASQGGISALWGQIISAVGVIVAIWGRVKASTTIG